MIRHNFFHSKAFLIFAANLFQFRSSIIIGQFNQLFHVNGPLWYCAGFCAYPVLAEVQSVFPIVPDVDLIQELLQEESLHCYRLSMI